MGWDGGAESPTEPFTFERMSLHPVTLSNREITDHLHGQCHAAISAVYHDGVHHPVFQREWRAAYREVNERYAHAAAGIAAPGGVVWVHDYHLQLVPAMLRAVRPDLLIGFFMHAPFPPVELFMQMPLRHEISRGLLGADVVGFQRPRAAGNFLALISDLLGMRPQSGEVWVDGRRALVVASTLSIDVDEVERLATDPGVVARSQAIRKELGEPARILLAVDRLAPAKGIEHRLRAFEELLAQRRLDPNATMLVQVSAPEQHRSASYRQLRERVERQVARINGVYGRVGRPVVEYLHRHLDRRDLVALYLAADVMVATPLRDGTSLAAKEYVASRTDDSGALVLSEFTGAAEVLPQALIVNPYDVDETKAALVEATTAAPAVLRPAMRAMRQRLREHDVSRWAGQFLSALGSRASA